MVTERIYEMIKVPYLYRQVPSALGMRDIYKDGVSDNSIWTVTDFQLKRGGDWVARNTAEIYMDVK
jgi:hypothetical protein